MDLKLDPSLAIVVNPPDVSSMKNCSSTELMIFWIVAVCKSRHVLDNSKSSKGGTVRSVVSSLQNPLATSKTCLKVIYNGG